MSGSLLERSDYFYKEFFYHDEHLSPDVCKRSSFKAVILQCLSAWADPAYVKHKKTCPGDVDNKSRHDRAGKHRARATGQRMLEISHYTCNFLTLDFLSCCLDGASVQGSLINKIGAGKSANQDEQMSTNQQASSLGIILNSRSQGLNHRLG